MHPWLGCMLQVFKELLLYTVGLSTAVSLRRHKENDLITSGHAGLEDARSCFAQVPAEQEVSEDGTAGTLCRHSLTWVWNGHACPWVDQHKVHAAACGARKDSTEAHCTFMTACDGLAQSCTCSVGSVPLYCCSAACRERRVAARCMAISCSSGANMRPAYLHSAAEWLHSHTECAARLLTGKVTIQ